MRLSFGLSLPRFWSVPKICISSSTAMPWHLPMRSLIIARTEKAPSLFHCVIGLGLSTLLWRQIACCSFCLDAWARRIQSQVWLFQAPFRYSHMRLGQEVDSLEPPRCLGALLLVVHDRLSICWFQEPLPCESSFCNEHDWMPTCTHLLRCACLEVVALPTNFLIPLLQPQSWYFWQSKIKSRC